MNRANQRETARELFAAAIKAVDPYLLVKQEMEEVRSRYRQTCPARINIISFGKAACPMARAAEENLDDYDLTGISITKYDHCIRTDTALRAMVYEAGHPVPDDNGIMATADVIRLLEHSDEKTANLFLVSGGGSSLLVAPCDGVTLADKRLVTRQLLESGAPIAELNAVRKHLSRVKGGRLAELSDPSSALALILSDVIGDRLDVIASGPTSPDESTYQEAIGILDRYGLSRKAPPAVMKVLEDGAGGLLPETPKKGSSVFKGMENRIIGSNMIALNAVREKAQELGTSLGGLFRDVSGEARKIGKWLAQEAIKLRNDNQGSRMARCLISGGETTVTVRGSGLGGRNMELALAFALEIEDIQGITLLSAGTDGTDGPTEAAGAFADGKTAGRGRAAGLDPRAFLTRNDSYHFFDELDDLFVTGPTGTNVMDIQIVMVR